MHGFLLLLVQIAVVLVVARGVGYAFRRIRQPQVVGEMVAGIILGPSLLGWVAPGASAALFPAESLGLLSGIAQVGLLLFMFLVGLELDPRLLRGRGRATALVSTATLAIPMLCGGLLAMYLYPRLSDASVSFTGFALFVSVSLSVTAFPVLARILAERNLLKTNLGAVTLACAAAADVGAWAVLAVILAVVRAEPGRGGADALPLWATLGGTVAFVAAAFFVLKPLLGRLERLHASRGRLTQDVLAGVLLALLVAAGTTEWLGVHALFGAFVIGTAIPREREFVRDLTERLEDVTVVLFLPLFFASAGLRTSIGLVSGAEMWGYTALICVVAIIAKFGGSAVAARAGGLPWREARALGVLMNTRGLMELVILTIGLDLGLISPALFAMLVLMAIATTFLTTPLLEWIYPSRLILSDSDADDAGDAPTTVVVPISLPSSGPSLLRVARALAPPDALRVYGLHLARVEQQTVVDLTEGTPPAESPLAPFLAAAAGTGLDVRPLDFVSRDPGRDIADVARQKAADLVLMGWHKPVVSESVLGGTVADVLRHTRSDVAVYLERSFKPWTRVLVPYRGGLHDVAALSLAQRIARTTGAEITLLHVVAPGADAAATRESFPDNVELRVVPSGDPVEALVDVAKEGFDLVVVGVSETWGLDPSPFSVRHERIARECPASMLIVRRHAEAAHS